MPPRVRKATSTATMPAELRKLLEDGGAEAIRKLTDLMESKDSTIVLAAAKALAERAYGRPRQEEGQGNAPLVTIVLPGWTDRPELCGRALSDEDRRPEPPPEEAAREAHVRKVIFGRVSGGQSQSVRRVPSIGGEDE